MTSKSDNIFNDLSPIQVVKLSQETSAPFNISNNILDLDLPSSLGVVDMSRSYLSLKASLLSGDNYVHNLYLASANDANDYFDASAFIKHCSIKCERGGMLEDMKYVNKLSHNLKKYTKSFTDDIKDSVKSGKVAEFYQQPSDEGEPDYATPLVNAFQKLYQLGTTTSSNLTPEIQIPLKDILPGVGSMPQFPIGHTGDCRIHIELEDLVPLIRERLPYALGVLDLQATHGAADNTFTTVHDMGAEYSNYRRCGLWVGGRIQIYNPASALVDTRTITQLNRNGNLLDIVVDGAPIAGVAGNWTINQVEAPAISWSISQVNCVLYKLNMPNEKLSQFGQTVAGQGVVIPFRTFSLEEYNQPAYVNGQSFVHQFDLEPKVANLMLLTPTDSLLSHREGCANFRWRILDEDSTSEDVFTGGNMLGPLYQDQLLKTMANSGLDVQMLLARNYNPLMVPTTVPISMGSLFATVRMTFDGNSNAKTIYLYKQVVRELALNANGVQVL